MTIAQPKSHTFSEGQRVHYLANLGGLVVISKLKDVDPCVLLGAFCEIKRKLKTLPVTRLEELKISGKKKLSERQAEKRSFKSWQRALQTERFDLSAEQIKKLIAFLGGKLPALDKDLGGELRRLLRSIFDGK